MGINISGSTDTISATDGGLIVRGVDSIVIAAGSSTAPSISPVGDSNTGIFFPSADTIAFAEGGVEAIRLNSSGNLGIGVDNPSEKLVVNGYIQTPNSSSGSVGLDIGYKKSVSITGSYSSNTWYDTGVSSLTDTGIYILDVWTDTYNAGGQTYQTSYVGLFVLANRNTNATNTSTITVHYSGHAPNNELFQFRTIQTLSNAGGTKLQWLSNFSLSGLDGSSGKRVEVSIHRFGSAINNA